MTGNFFIGLIKLGAFGLMGLLAASWLQNLHPAFDTPSHFRLHFAAVLLGASLLLLLTGAWRWMVAGLAIVGVTAFLTHPYLPSLDSFSVRAANAVSNQPPADLTVLQLNIRFNNRTVERTAKVVLEAQPDVVLLQEITRNNEAILDQLLQAYPHQWYCHRRGIGSVAILSRHAFVDHKSSTCLETRGFAQAKIQFADRVLSLATFHSRWPYPASQPRQMQVLKDGFEGLTHPLVLAGDFNSAPWSAAVQRAARWTRTKVAEGVVMTWGSPMSFVRNTVGPSLPIDQMLYSPELSLLERWVLEDVGSDHYPILSRFQFR